MAQTLIIELGPELLKIIRELLTEEAEVRFDPAAEAALERLREDAAREVEELAADKDISMPLCACGCGNPVRHLTNKYLHGHCGGRPRKDMPARELVLKEYDLPIVNDQVECPKIDRWQEIDDCESCSGFITRIKDPETAQRYIRCAKGPGAP